MESKYSLEITPEIMSVCTNKYEAVMFSVFATELKKHEEDASGAWLLGVTDKEISQRTQGLILPREVPKYLQMLMDKRFIYVQLDVTSPDRLPAFVNVDKYEKEVVTISSGDLGSWKISLNGSPSDLIGCSFLAKGAERKIISRDICFCYHMANEVYSKQQAKNTAEGQEVPA